jgi:hypothetical protein
MLPARARYRHGRHTQAACRFDEDAEECAPDLRQLVDGICRLCQGSSTYFFCCRDKCL